MAGFSHMPSANAGVFFSRSFSCSYEQRNPDSTVSTTFIDFALEVQLVFPLSRPRRMLSLSNELLPMKTLAHCTSQNVLNAGVVVLRFHPLHSPGPCLIDVDASSGNSDHCFGHFIAHATNN
jgi:hypothetical protein